jgi:hypothetical protein
MSVARLDIYNRKKLCMDGYTQPVFSAYLWDTTMRREVCREQIQLHETHGNWRYNWMIERYSCFYLSADCVFDPRHNEWKKYYRGKSREYWATCVECKRSRTFKLLSLDDGGSKAKCNYCVPPIAKAKKKRKPLVLLCTKTGQRL